MKTALQRARNKLQRLIFPSLSSSLERMQIRLESLEATTKKLNRDNRKAADRMTAVVDLLAPLYMDSHRIDTSEMTAQERAWFGKHGFRYIIHHMGEDWQKTRVPFWSQALSLVPDVTSVCEFGANIGANLKAIRSLRPEIEIHGIEVNPVACEILRQEGFQATQGSIAETSLGRQFDFVFSRGVLIHIKPSELADVMRLMAAHSSRYVMIFEHYSETMHSLDAYGEAVTKTTGESSEGYQFWGDFSGEFAKLFPDWNVVRSGVQATPDQRPKHGDLHWTIFRRPG